MKKVILAAVIVLLIGGAVYAYIIQKGNKETPIICTQEALLCPDGSYVSRHGQDCAFSNCPNSGPFEGKLIQVSGGFQLIIASPNTTGQEVSYALPLEIGNASDAIPLVGKKVAVSGEFVGGITYKVNSIEPAGDLTLGDVKVGNSMYINGVVITLNSITQDSRCPIDVVCVQAGSVTANVKLKSDTDSETIDIESGQSPISFDSFKISINKVTPQKTSGQTIDQQSYAITFKVVSN